MVEEEEDVLSHVEEVLHDEFSMKLRYDMRKCYLVFMKKRKKNKIMKKMESGVRYCLVKRCCLLVGVCMWSLVIVR